MASAKIIKLISNNMEKTNKDMDLSPASQETGPKKQIRRRKSVPQKVTTQEQSQAPAFRIDGEWVETDTQAITEKSAHEAEETQPQERNQEQGQVREIITFEKVNILAKDIDITKAYPSDTGFDLQANLESTVILGPGQRARIGTGIKVTIPDYIDAQIRPKSGLAFKKGITVLNTPGTIDPGYTGELKVIIINLGNTEVHIEPGMKIAQLTFNYKAPVTLREEQSLRIIESPESGENHGTRGFGSAGLLPGGK